MVSNVNLLGESPSHKYAHSWLHRTTNNEKLCKHIYGFINKRIIYCISFFFFSVRMYLLMFVKPY